MGTAGAAKAAIAIKFHELVASPTRPVIRQMDCHALSYSQPSMNLDIPFWFYLFNPC